MQSNSRFREAEHDTHTPPSLNVNSNRALRAQSTWRLLIQFKFRVRLFKAIGTDHMGVVLALLLVVFGGFELDVHRTTFEPFGRLSKDFSDGLWIHLVVDFDNDFIVNRH